MRRRTAFPDRGLSPLITSGTQRCRVATRDRATGSRHRHAPGHPENGSGTDPTRQAFRPLTCPTASPQEFAIFAPHRFRRLIEDHPFERGILVALLLAAGLAWGFAELADEVMEGTTLPFDNYVYGQVHEAVTGDGFLAAPQILEAVRDITALGSYSVLGVMIAVVCGFLTAVGQGRAALFVLLAVLGGMALSSGLKLAFERARPDPVAHQAIVFTASFPSGHSLLATVVYLTLGALLARLQAAWQARVFLIAAAVLLSVAVGLSRLLLGVHWPTDILSGWAVGAAWSLLCWALYHWSQRHGVVPETAGGEV